MWHTLIVGPTIRCSVSLEWGSNPAVSRSEKHLERDRRARPLQGDACADEGRVEKGQENFGLWCHVPKQTKPVPAQQGALQCRLVSHESCSGDILVSRLGTAFE